MPFGADTPTPEFVGNSRVRGARSPPRTPRDPTTPSRAHLGPAAGHTDPPGDFARAKWRSVPPAGLLHGKAEKRRPPGLHQSKVGKCARRRFRAAGRCARPGGKNRPPGEKNRGFFRPLRACIRKRGLLFRKKTVDFSAWQSDGCTHQAGNRP